MDPPLKHCPHCHLPTTGLALYPMSFAELDQARSKELPQKKKSKKRKEPGASYDDGTEIDCRTGRWTVDEMAFCDKLIDTFKTGDLPIAEGVKLNDFLAAMLKSKQSRLTKKMKNANLSGKIFKVGSGYIQDLDSCKSFSEIEQLFLSSLSDPHEQASVRFHMQKQWREMFSSFCVSIGQALDADAWLSSVEEMEKRESVAKDAARMARRKMMMGIALNQDTQNPDQGVFIERGATHESAGLYDNFCLDHDDLSLILSDKPSGPVAKGRPGNVVAGERHYWHYSSPFLGKAISYLQRHGCPFEHVDVWVPSFLPDSDASQGSGSMSGNSNCRLCFAGSATADVQVPSDGVSSPQMLSQDEQFHLLSFGDYSQKFSFNVGCGLPGRVYENGVPAWEQSVQNAPHQHFERCGGAIQWGIKTVVGIPVPSPNVGRIVVILYSRYDRSKDQELVGRLYDEFKKVRDKNESYLCFFINTERDLTTFTLLFQMVPSPKWKLVVDIGQPMKHSTNPSQREIATPLLHKSSSCTSVNANSNSTSKTLQVANGTGRDSRSDELVALLGEQMPHDPNSPQSSYLQHFMSLRLMMLKPSRSPEETEMEGILLSSYSSYKSSGRQQRDIAVMIARDYMFLKQQHQQMPRPAQHQSPQLTGLGLNPSFYQPGPVAQHYQAPAQQANLDASNHSVVGLALLHDRHNHHNQHHGAGIPDVSNHSIVHLGPPPAHHQQNGMTDVPNHSNNVNLGHHQAHRGNS